MVLQSPGGREQSPEQLTWLGWRAMQQVGGPRSLGEGRPWGVPAHGPVQPLRLEPQSGSSRVGNRPDVEAEPCWGAFRHSHGEEAPEPLRVTEV